MKRIPQRKKNDCGVACVAMLIQRYADCPATSAYDAAKAVMFGKKNAGRTKTSDIRRALNIFGMDCGRKRVKFKPVSCDDMGLDFDAIIGTRPGSADGWHWLVWDAGAKVLLDPLKEENFHRFAMYYIRVKRN